MTWGAGSTLRAIALALCCIFAALSPVHAAEAPRAAPCWQTLPLSGQASDYLAELGPWTCGESQPPVGNYRIALTWNELQASEPKFLVSRIGQFGQVTLASQDRAGRWITSLHKANDAQPLTDGPRFKMELPRPPSGSTRTVVIFDRPLHLSTMSSAKLLAEDPALDPDSIIYQLLIAGLLGIILIPLFFDLVFWRVLRQNFLLWHSALIGSFALLLLCRSGMVNHMLDLPIEVWRRSLIMTFGLALAVSFMFTRAYIEDDKISPVMRRWVPYAAAWALIASAIHAASFDFMRPFGSAFHSIALAPLMVLILVLMIDAWRRGSRAVRFQMVGWTPLFIGVSIQFVTYVTPLAPPNDALPIFFFGMLTESLATALGVADRFLAIRRQRDKAEDRVAALDALSSVDPLTGLYNRRALDIRMGSLRADGYNTFALLDLDHFKTVNDTIGHAGGDAVLVEVAAILSSDEQSLGFRLGGEEFLLVMKGEDSLDRAEKLRQAISLRVARQIDGLERILTASVGAIVLPKDRREADIFSDIYSRADKLLYEAKEGGRNRLVFEKLRLFSARKPDRRRAAAV